MQPNGLTVVVVVFLQCISSGQFEKKLCQVQVHQFSLLFHLNSTVCMKSSTLACAQFAQFDAKFYCTVKLTVLSKTQIFVYCPTKSHFIRH